MFKKTQNEKYTKKSEWQNEKNFRDGSDVFKRKKQRWYNFGKKLIKSFENKIGIRIFKLIESIQFL